MSKDPKSTRIIKTNRGYTLTMTCHYADNTPDGFLEEVCCVLEYCGIFDGLKVINPKIQE